MTDPEIPTKLDEMLKVSEQPPPILSATSKIGQRRGRKKINRDIVIDANKTPIVGLSTDTSFHQTSAKILSTSESVPSEHIEPKLVIPISQVSQQSPVPILNSTSQELFYTLHLNLPQQTYQDLMVGKIEKVVDLIKSIKPLTLPPRFASWRDIKPTKKKVAIVGFADSKDLAPYKDDSWEIWGLNSLFEIIDMTYVTRWFEIHDRKIFSIDTNKEIGYGLTRTGQPYLQALTQLNCPVYMVDKYEDIANSVRYPLEEMITEFDPRLKKLEWSKPFSHSADLDWNGYFTNTISYMIALAIHDCYEEIGIYGVDMATSQGGIGGEYAAQRPSCEYYIGVALGRGIKVTIPDEADLLKTRFIYGFEMMRDLAFSNKVRKINEAMGSRFGASQQTYAMAQKQMDQYIGAMECIKELDKIWRNCAYGKEFEQAFDKFMVSMTPPKVST